MREGVAAEVQSSQRGQLDGYSYIQSFKIAQSNNAMKDSVDTQLQSTCVPERTIPSVSMAGKATASSPLVAALAVGPVFLSSVSGSLNSMVVLASWICSA